jgi:hypothetical protein
MSNPGLARPNRIWIYNFVANPADMPADASIKGDVAAPSTPPTAEQIEEGRRLGALIAQDLVADINQMGLTAVQAGPGCLARTRLPFHGRHDRSCDRLGASAATAGGV